MRELVDRWLHHTGRVLLGGFVLWQAFFLGSSCFVEVEESLRVRGLGRWPAAQKKFPNFMAGEDKFHQKLTAFNKKGLRRYGQATAQPQQWSLFAPNLAEVFSFGTLEVRWDADHLEASAVETHALEPLLLSGFNEPADVQCFLRYKNFRIRKYEEHIMPTPRRIGGVFDPHSEAWRDRLADDVRDNGENMQAYMRWRWEEYRRHHEAVPEPTQLVLLMHGYEIPPPPGPQPWRFTDLGQHPVARWLPWKADQSGVRAFEQYDPVNDRYESTP